MLRPFFLCGQISGDPGTNKIHISEKFSKWSSTWMIFISKISNFGELLKIIEMELQIHASPLQSSISENFCRFSKWSSGYLIVSFKSQPFRITSKDSRKWSSTWMCRDLSRAGSRAALSWTSDVMCLVVVDEALLPPSVRVRPKHDVKHDVRGGKRASPRNVGGADQVITAAGSWSHGQPYLGQRTPHAARKRRHRLLVALE